MNQKELSEIRRHLTPDKNNIGTVYGCYVNGNKEIISYLDESLGLMDEFETEKYLGFLKKVLSGGLGKGLVDIVFTADQVMNGEEHKLLMSLWSSSLADADAREQLYRKIIETLDFKEHNYLILLACDHYDVPYRGADGEIQKDASESMFSYLLCSVCPVKDGRPELGYAPMENGFRRHNSVQLVGAPEVGFMFPAFNDRAAAGVQPRVLGLAVRGAQPAEIRQAEAAAALYLGHHSAERVGVRFKQQRVGSVLAAEVDEHTALFGDLRGIAEGFKLSLHPVRGLHGEASGAVDAKQFYGF